MVSKWVQVCDLDHDEDVEDVPAVESVTFNVGGKTFELDLCSQHYVQWQAFEAQQSNWQRAARVQQGEAATSAPRRGRMSDSAEHRKENTAIREWVATQPDLELAERGRIPDSIRQRYRDAMGAQARNRWDASTDDSSPNGTTPVAVGAPHG